MLQEQKSLVAAGHPLAQPGGSTPWSMNPEGPAGSCKHRGGFLSLSSLCTGSRTLCSGLSLAASTSSALQSSGCPGAVPGAVMSWDPIWDLLQGLKCAQLCSPLPGTSFHLQRQGSSCWRNQINLAYKISFEKLCTPYGFGTLNAILIHF